MKLTQAWQGYLLYAEARPLSQNTINDYRRTFEKFLKFRGDVEVGEICRQDIERFVKPLPTQSRELPMSGVDFVIRTLKF